MFSILLQNSHCDVTGYDFLAHQLMQKVHARHMEGQAHTCQGSAGASGGSHAAQTTPCRCTKYERFQVAAGRICSNGGKQSTCAKSAKVVKPRYEASDYFNSKFAKVVSRLLHDSSGGHYLHIQKLSAQSLHTVKIILPVLRSERDCASGVQKVLPSARMTVSQGISVPETMVSPVLRGPKVPTVPPARKHNAFILKPRQMACSTCMHARSAPK